MKRDITFGYVVSTVESKLLENVGFTNQLAKINDPIVIVNQFQDRPLGLLFWVNMSRSSIQKPGVYRAVET